MTLIGDDYVHAVKEQGRIYLTAPDAIRGQLEIRGIGIMKLASKQRGELKLVIDLVPDDFDVERLPVPWPETKILSTSIPCLQLKPFEASAPMKILLSLHNPNLFHLPN